MLGIHEHKWPHPVNSGTNIFRAEAAVLQSGFIEQCLAATIYINVFRSLRKVEQQDNKQSKCDCELIIKLIKSLNSIKYD